MIRPAYRLGNREINRALFLETRGLAQHGLPKPSQSLLAL